MPAAVKGGHPRPKGLGPRQHRGGGGSGGANSTTRCKFGVGDLETSINQSIQAAVFRVGNLQGNAFLAKGEGEAAGDVCTVD